MNMTIEHGEIGAPGAVIELRAEAHADRVELEIRDAGQEFTSLTVAPPRPPASIAKAVPGGLGIHLVRSFCDRAQYQRREGKNVFSFSVPREAPATGPVAPAS